MVLPSHTLKRLYLTLRDYGELRSAGEGEAGLKDKEIRIAVFYIRWAAIHSYVHVHSWAGLMVSGGVEKKRISGAEENWWDRRYR